jgi:hypothetical protein
MRSAFVIGSHFYRVMVTRSEGADCRMNGVKTSRRRTHRPLKQSPAAVFKVSAGMRGYVATAAFDLLAFHSTIAADVPA